jgi:hypothetical protein
MRHLDPGLVTGQVRGAVRGTVYLYEDTGCRVHCSIYNM